MFTGKPQGRLSKMDGGLAAFSVSLTECSVNSKFSRRLTKCKSY